MTLFEEFNLQYAKYFTENYPARTTVSAKLKAGAVVEVSVVSYKA